MLVLPSREDKVQKEVADHADEDDPSREEHDQHYSPGRSPHRKQLIDRRFPLKQTPGDDVYAKRYDDDISNTFASTLDAIYYFCGDSLRATHTIHDVTLEKLRARPYSNGKAVEKEEVHEVARYAHQQPAESLEVRLPFFSDLFFVTVPYLAHYDLTERMQEYCNTID